MTEETGFALTAAERKIVLSPLLMVGVSLPIAFVITLLVGVPLLYALIGLAVSAAAMGLPFIHLARKDYVFLSSRGLRGRAPSGNEVLIPWDQEVRVNSGTSGHLRGVLVFGKDDRYPAFVPEGIARSEPFVRLVRTYAAASHPLRDLDPQTLSPAPERRPGLLGKLIGVFVDTAEQMTSLSSLVLILIMVFGGLIGPLAILAAFTKGLGDVNFKLAFAGVGITFLALVAWRAIDIQNRRERDKRQKQKSEAKGGQE